jgi:protein-tyrosine-phosphatase
MAQIIFANLCEKNARNDITVFSAGTDALEGQPITFEAIEALKAVGEKIPPKILTSTRWRKEMLNEFDHIVCMTKRHALKIDPGGIYGHVYTLDSAAGCGDITDPWAYPPDIYIKVCKLLQNALEILYNSICKK